MATQYNLPTISGNASLEDMDRLTFRDIPGASLHQDLTTLDQAALTRRSWWTHASRPPAAG